MTTLRDKTPGDGVEPLRADDWRLGAWRGFLRAHADIVRRLEADLVEQANLPLSWYDVLLQLAEAPERRLRMAELADRLLLSRSGLTRLIDRMQVDGLVARAPYPGDARGTYTVLTAAGLDRLRAAAPIHLAGISEYWIARLSEAELRQLAALFDRIAPEVGY